MKTSQRTLAIETASEACSVALFEGDELLQHEHRVLGRGHAEQLIPMIADLPAKGRADRILVSLGPGSFTGVRIGIASARALGVAWQAQVLGYPTLAMIAAMALDQGHNAVTVSMNGGHGEWFVQNFQGGSAQDEIRSLTPDLAVDAAVHEVFAGNRAEQLAGLSSGELTALPLLPDARFALQIRESLLTTTLSPIYGRAPDATPQRAVPAT